MENEYRDPDIKSLKDFEEKYGPLPEMNRERIIYTDEELLNYIARCRYIESIRENSSIEQCTNSNIIFSTTAVHSPPRNREERRKYEKEQRKFNKFKKGALSNETR